MTIIEIVIVIALMAILTGVYFVVANPAGQLASSRNSERKFHLQTILNAVRQNMADNRGQFQCSSGPMPTSTKRMTSVAGVGNYNIAPCLLAPGGILFTMPFDPSASSSRYNSVTDYDTAYTIMINASGTVTLFAPYTETSTRVTSTVTVSG
jgi:type II secretory pathway pseudopilin PulG